MTLRIIYNWHVGHYLIAIQEITRCHCRIGTNHMIQNISLAGVRICPAMKATMRTIKLVIQERNCFAQDFAARLLIQVWICLGYFIDNSTKIVLKHHSTRLYKLGILRQKSEQFFKVNYIIMELYLFTLLPMAFFLGNGIVVTIGNFSLSFEFNS